LSLRIRIWIHALSEFVQVIFYIFVLSIEK
jgi:hypothetical protein